MQKTVTSYIAITIKPFNWSSAKLVNRTLAFDETRTCLQLDDQRFPVLTERCTNNVVRWDHIPQQDIYYIDYGHKHLFMYVSVRYKGIPKCF